MKIKIYTYLELLGMFILLVAFVWQMHSVYMSQWVTNAKLYKFETALDQILMCEVDEAIKDSTRYKGEAVMWVDYDGVRNFSEAYYEDAKRIEKWQDSANQSWAWQVVLYFIGSLCVWLGKAWNSNWITFDKKKRE